jgi:hypothetical protein
VSYVPVCVNSLGCGITGQHTVECLERMVSGLWEEQLRMQPVIDAARAWVEQDFGNEVEYAAVVRALIDAVHALDSAQCCTNIDPHTPGGSNCR